MNNNRLSTSKVSLVNRKRLLEYLALLLSQPSNYALVYGRIFMKFSNKSLNTHKAV